MLLSTPSNVINKDNFPFCWRNCVYVVAWRNLWLFVPRHCPVYPMFALDLQPGSTMYEAYGREKPAPKLWFRLEITRNYQTLVTENRLCPPTVTATSDYIRQSTSCVEEEDKLPSRSKTNWRSHRQLRLLPTWISGNEATLEITQMACYVHEPSIRNPHFCLDY